MEKLSSLTNFCLMISAGVFASACGPLAPSVSKFANNQGQKTSPAGAAHPENIQQDGGLNSAHNGAILPGNHQQTLSVTPSRYRKILTLIRDAKPTMELEEATIDKLRNSQNGDVVFFSTDERIKGHEESLSGTKTRIFLSMHTDNNTHTRLDLYAVQMNLNWNATAGHWELTLVPPNTGDPAKDTNELNQILTAIRENLTDISIEFQAE